VGRGSTAEALSRYNAIGNGLALTPTLSPKERERVLSTIARPRIRDSFERSQVILPPLGERLGASLSLTALTQRGKAATKGKELTQRFSQEETERTEKKKERARGKGKRILTTETQRRENEANITLLKMKSFAALTRSVWSGASFSGAFLSCQQVNPKRRNTAHSIRFARSIAPLHSVIALFDYGSAELCHCGKNLVLAILLLFSLPAFSQLELLPERAPVSIFGGGTRKIVTMWQNPTDSLLEVGVRFKLYQASSATAAPFKDIFWKTLQVLPGQTVLESALVRFPHVNAETQFIIQWIADSKQILGKIDVLVYPHDLLKEMKPLAGDDSIGLFDPADILKPLFRTLSIDLTDLQDIGLDQFHGRLAILGPFESTTQMPETFEQNVKAMARKSASVVWLQAPRHPHEFLKPSFCILHEGRGTIVLAQADLAANLLENPESQLNLVQLARMAVHPEMCKPPQPVAR